MRKTNRIKINNKDDLHFIYKTSQSIIEEITKQVKKTYMINNLSITKINLKGMKGDIYSKVLGNYLKKMCNVSPQYETSVTYTNKKGKKNAKMIDILINNI